MSHARAVQLLSSKEIKSKYIAVIGTNIDVGHGVLQSDIDARLNDLSSSTVFTWLWQYEQDDDIHRYVDIVSRCCPRHTIVHSLICAALQGRRGYYLPEHLVGRIYESLVQLSEETCVSIRYHFDDVIRDNIYFERLTPEMNLNEVHNIIYGTNDNVLSSMGIEEVPSAQDLWLSRLKLCLPSTKIKRSSPRKKKPE